MQYDLVVSSDLISVQSMPNALANYSIFYSISNVTHASWLTAHLFMFDAIHQSQPPICQYSKHERKASFRPNMLLQAKYWSTPYTYIKLVAAAHYLWNICLAVCLKSVARFSFNFCSLDGYFTNLTPLLLFCCCWWRLRFRVLATPYCCYYGWCPWTSTCRLSVCCGAWPAAWYYMLMFNLELLKLVRIYLGYVPPFKPMFESRGCIGVYLLLVFGSCVPL